MNSEVRHTTRPTRRRRMRVAAALTGAACLAGGTGVLTATPAYAGTNGQQVRVGGARVSYRVSVKGDNQNGRYVQWGFHHVTSQHGFIVTTGWWWKGVVNIHAITNNGLMEVSTYCSVPTDYPSNVYDCPL